MLACCLTGLHGEAQVSSVQFGKNRIQYRKFNWRFYQTSNFNVHFTQGGLELAKYALQIAEEELPQLEGFTEIALQRRCNVVLYNTYDDKQATNIGLGNDILPDVGGLTTLVNNKMVIYFDGNHANLRRQIREGIARVLVDNRLFGENLGEVASNATLLDLPKWLTDGYVRYAAEPWSVALDDQAKNALLAGEYRNFYQLAFAEPDIAGHAFWNYIANTYKPDNVTYFLYLSILYKNVNSASLRVCKKKFKEVLADFMRVETEKYYEDIRARRNYPKGTVTISEDVNQNKDFYHFAPSPNVRSYTYAVAEYKKGKYSVSLYENYVNRKVLIKNGVRVMKHQRNPNYPIMAWDGKGSRLAVVYWEKGKVKLMVHDITTGQKTVDHVLPFDQVQDAQYYLDAKRLIMSAVKNGHTDIYVYTIDGQKLQQITNDVWDDIDASFVSFPNKYGILFSSNRPLPQAPGSDTSLPGLSNFNVFLVDVDDKAGFRQITQLTNLKFGDARYPTQYNMNHFTFVGTENGVGNRYAGFFTTKAEGLDTLLFVGTEVLRNPERKELDSTLRAWDRTEPDSVGYIRITRDSTYTFPISNYASSLLETRIAGDKGMVSEVTQESGVKNLYRLRVDSVGLRRRNVNARPTAYMKSKQLAAKAAAGQATYYGAKGADTAKKAISGFFSEFDNDKVDTTTGGFFSMFENQGTPRISALTDAKLYKYKLKFSNDAILAGVTSNLLINRFQPYAGGSGPIQLNNGNNLSWAFTASLSDVMEDYRITGGIRPGINFTDNEYFVSYQNYRRRIDWGATYYRAANSNFRFYNTNPDQLYDSKLFTTMYQGNVTLPFDVVRSLRLTMAYRNDRIVLRPQNLASRQPDRYGLGRPDSNLRFINTRLEYVWDNALMKAQNIWNGLRWKVYAENIAQINKVAFVPGQPVERQFTFNLGGDVRYYLPIYRNFIWAGRGALDVSWGKQKLIYYLGGVDGWLTPRFEDGNRPNPTARYAYQSLALNLRGFNQNVANGNNAVVLNSEFRLPVFTTFFNKPINNAFIRNFQLVQFVDLGTAWEGNFSGIKRPALNYRAANNPVLVRIKSGGVGPFAGGYGFGVRSTLLGYIIKVDSAWPMNGFFEGKPAWYFSLGLDF
ncbi:MAG: hypothetical protein EAY75_04405 [Bacteroidetes bacterium]|nr:MAG: hypothetical protein EAY75_04405 [Bacteroidota bacterium]